MLEIIISSIHKDYKQNGFGLSGTGRPHTRAMNAVNEFFKLKTMNLIFVNNTS